VRGLSILWPKPRLTKCRPQYVRGLVIIEPAGLSRHMYAFDTPFPNVRGLSILWPKPRLTKCRPQYVYTSPTLPCVVGEGFAQYGPAHIYSRPRTEPHSHAPHSCSPSPGYGTIRRNPHRSPAAAQVKGPQPPPRFTVHNASLALNDPFPMPASPPASAIVPAAQI
jgi:hypothetical protein